MLQHIYKHYNAVTAPEGRAGAGIDIERAMERYAINLSAARVLKVIDRLVAASRKRGVKDKRGIPYCYASKEWIAGKIGKSLRTVARAIRDLKAAGLIECKRTQSNAMLFITGYEPDGNPEPVRQPEPEPVRQTEREAMPGAETKRESAPSFAPENANSGTSGSGKNGTSNIRTKSVNNNKHNPSIDRIPCAGETGRSARLGQGAGEGRAAACLDEEVRRRIEDELRRQIIATGDGDFDLIGQYRTIQRMIAETVAAKQDVRVNGVMISADQYWENVRYVNGRHLDEVIKAVAARDCMGMIKNRRAYLLSSVYNCALWDRFSDAADYRELMRQGGYGA